MVLDYLAKFPKQFFWLRFVNKFQRKFRSRDPESSPDMFLLEEIFMKCDPFIYCMQMTNHPDYHKFVISKKSMAMREYIVVLPKMPLDHGSQFGSCTSAFLGRKPYPVITW